MANETWSWCYYYHFYVLWVTNMTMFVTTLYISRLDLLEELNFDYSEVNKTT